MLLVPLWFKHYAPKDSEEGIKEFLVVDNIDQLIEYVDNEHMYGRLQDQKDDEQESSLSFAEEWIAERPHKVEEASELGIVLDVEYHSAEGPSHLLTRWWGGNDWEEVSDLYYGATQWNWEKRQEITEEELAVLMKLGLVKDIRKGYISWRDA